MICSATDVACGSSRNPTSVSAGSFPRISRQARVLLRRSAGRPPTADSGTPSRIPASHQGTGRPSEGGYGSWPASRPTDRRPSCAVMPSPLRPPDRRCRRRSTRDSDAPHDRDVLRFDVLDSTSEEHLARQGGGDDGVEPPCARRCRCCYRRRTPVVASFTTVNVWSSSRLRTLRPRHRRSRPAMPAASRRPRSVGGFGPARSGRGITGGTRSSGLGQLGGECVDGVGAGRVRHAAGRPLAVGGVSGIPSSRGKGHRGSFSEVGETGEGGAGQPVGPGTAGRGVSGREPSAWTATAELGGDQVAGTAASTGERAADGRTRGVGYGHRSSSSCEASSAHSIDDSCSKNRILPVGP